MKGGGASCSLLQQGTEAMKMLMQQMSRDLAELGAKGWKGDGLLIAAKVLLYILLVGVILGLVATAIGLVTYLASRGSDLLVSPLDPVWRPVSRLVIAWIALDTVAGMVLRLMALIDTVETGDAFATDNAARLEWIGGAVVGLMALGFVAGQIGVAVRGDINGFPISIDPAPGGVAIALLLFILARVFRKGAEMQGDLEGTV